MLLSKSSSDLLAADPKYGNHDIFRDLRLESLSLLLVENDVLLKEIDFRRIILIVKFLNGGNWVQLVLLVVFRVSLNVGVQGVYCLVKTACKGLIKVVDPGILIWKLSLILNVWVFWLVKRPCCCFQIGFHIRFEEVRQ